MSDRRLFLLRTCAGASAVIGAAFSHAFGATIDGALPGTAQVEPMPDAVALGMTETDLRALRPALKPNRHPPRNATGALGRWSESVDTTPLGPCLRTYYIVDGQLDQVDLTRVCKVGAEGPQVFAQAVALLIDRYGEGLRSAESDTPTAGAAPTQFESMTWAIDARDVYITRTAASGRDVVRLVERRRHLQDASQL